MKTCKCGRHIGLLEEYCEYCKKNLSLMEKVIEGIRYDKMFCLSKTGVNNG